MSERYPLEGWVALKADDHRADVIRGGCTCGFAVWSPEHVAIMAYREAVDWAPTVTPEQLSEALQRAKEFPGHEMDWPYIDEFVIDGCLEPLVGWLCQHYVIVPRTTTIPPPNLSTTEGES